MNEKPAISGNGEWLRRRDMWMRYVINSDLGEWPRIVGVSLALRMTAAQPYCWPGQALISKEVGCARATVNRAVGQLVDKGLLVRTNRKMGNDAGKDSRQYTYTIRLPHEF